MRAETIAQASEHAADEMDFLGDIFASEEYRQHLVKVYTKRAPRGLGLSAEQKDHRQHLVKVYTKRALTQALERAR